MQFHNVEEYVQQRFPPTPFYIQNLLPVGGRLLLFGRPGIKKSWLAEHMGYCVATGTDWLNFQTTPAATLLVNFELAPISYHHRLVLMKRHFENAELLWECSPRNLFLDDNTDFSRFLDSINELNPSVIVLDCLSKCFAGDENSSKDIGKFIRNIDELIGDNRGVIIVHHSNKNLITLDPIDKARGHTKLAGWVDSAIFMIEQPTFHQLFFVKHRLSPVELHPQSIVFRDYTWIPRARQRQETEEVRYD